MTTGMVYLVGAGPGDPGLLTLRGAEVLREAQVVLYDALVDEAVLKLASPDAERVCVGKRAGGSRTPQDEINRLLIDHARRGRVVVRLKGGDPFMFGRGGEEALALAEAGIPFEVVPGVTAAVAAGAYAGIPLTHRGLASACIFVTGHEDPAKPESDINWPALASSGATLCIYMGLGQLATLTDTLIRHGRAAGEGAAVIGSATLPEQKTVVNTLAGITDAVAGAGVVAPAMLIVGAVTSLRDKLTWLERRPLFAKKVVITRPAEQSADLIEKLTLLGARPAPFPTIEVRAIEDYSEFDETLASLTAFDWVVFTSANAVRVFFERLDALGRDGRAFGICRVAVIGPATAEALRRFGIRADCVPAEYVAESLLAALKSAENLAGKRVLVPRSNIGRDVLIEGLRTAGTQVSEVTVYRTVLASHSPEACRRLIESSPDVLTFTSSSTASNFVTLLGKVEAEGLAKSATVASIGPVTTRTLEALGLPVHVEAAEQTIAGLVQALVNTMTQDSKSG